jgi:hypothetical protein
MAKKIKRPIRFIARKDLKANPNKVYLFGDNIQEKGYGGQAKEMRGEANAIGIPTKKAPNMRSDAFFTDSEFNENKKAIDKAFNKIPAGKEVVIPESGIGTGLADLKNKAPKTFKYIQSKLSLLKSHGGKKTVTNIPTKTSPQKKILFTGLDKAQFKTGNKMIKVVREAVKKYGKNNVTLIHGGRPNKSVIDKNIIDLGKYTGVKVEADPLDYSIPKNAAGIRTQKRIDDPNLEWHSFDSKGNLSQKDKYQTYWKNKYGDIGKETSGGKLKFPRSTVKDGKVIGKQTKETSKFKTLLDEIEDDTNPERQASGVRYAKNLDKWTKENLGVNMITEKNQSRIDYLESGGIITKEFNKELGINEPKFIRGLPTGSTEYKAIEDFGEKTYIETDRDSLNTAGKPQITRIKKGTTSPFSGKDISGKSLSKTMKVKNRGTILTEPTVVSVNRTGDMTDRQIASKNPYSQSSMSQLGSNQELDDFKGQGREVTRRVELKDNLKQLTDQTDITEKGYGEDKSKSGKGIERHTASHLIKEQPIKDRVEIKRTLKKYAPVFQRIAEAKVTAKKSSNIPRRVKNLKRIDNVARNLAKQIPDRLAFDAAQPSDTSTPARSTTVQSSGLKNVPVPKATKVEKVKATKAKIAKGPLGGRKAKGTGWWEGTRRRITPVGTGNFPFALNIFSTGVGIARARKEAKQYTQKKDPSFSDTMSMMYPHVLGLPRKKHGLNFGDL